MQRILVCLYGLILLASGCATPFQTLQSDLQSIYDKGFGPVNADMQAILTSAAADKSANTISDIQYQQLIACPNAVLGLSTYIQQQLQTTVPPGAGVGWLLYEIRAKGDTVVTDVTTQAKLVKGTCEAMTKIPGLPF